MRKFLLLCCTLLLTAIGASAQYEEAYQAALSTLQSGKNYRVYTEWAGQKYYLNTAGILVGDSEDAGIFTFTAVKQAGTILPVSDAVKAFAGDSMKNYSFDKGAAFAQAVTAADPVAEWEKIAKDNEPLWKPVVDDLNAQ